MVRAWMRWRFHQSLDSRVSPLLQSIITNARARVYLLWASNDFDVEREKMFFTQQEERRRQSAKFDNRGCAATERRQLWKMRRELRRTLGLTTVLLEAKCELTRQKIRHIINITRKRSCEVKWEKCIIIGNLNHFTGLESFSVELTKTKSIKVKRNRHSCYCNQQHWGY
jgi:hypothetical protein